MYTYLSYICLTRDSAVTVFPCIFDTKVQISRVNFPFFFWIVNAIWKRELFMKNLRQHTGSSFNFHVRNKISIVKLSAALTDYFPFGTKNCLKFKYSLT